MTLEQIVTDRELSRALNDAGMDGESLFNWYSRRGGTPVVCDQYAPLHLHMLCPCWTLAELLAHPKMEEAQLYRGYFSGVGYRPCAEMEPEYTGEPPTSEFADTPTQAAGKLLLALLERKTEAKR